MFRVLGIYNVLTAFKWFHESTKPDFSFHKNECCYLHLQYIRKTKSQNLVDSGFMKLSDELINDLMKPCVKVQLQLLKHFSPILHCAPEG